MGNQTVNEKCPVCLLPIPAHEATCPSCGFKVSGRTQEFKPVSLASSEVATESKDVSGALLKVVRGPQTGVTYALSDAEHTIGRSPHCSIFLNDMTVSRMHATLRREGDCYVISDERSYNGVWVNNVNVGSKALNPGDFIQIGTFCLLYEEHDG